MKKAETFSELLKSASKSVKQTAHRKRIPIAISEDGSVKLIYPDHTVKVVYRISRRKEKV